MLPSRLFGACSVAPGPSSSSWIRVPILLKLDRTAPPHKHQQQHPCCLCRSCLCTDVSVSPSFASHFSAWWTQQHHCFSQYTRCPRSTLHHRLRYAVASTCIRRRCRCARLRPSFSLQSPAADKFIIYLRWTTGPRKSPSMSSTCMTPVVSQRSRSPDPIHTHQYHCERRYDLCQCQVSLHPCQDLVCICHRDS